MASGGGIISVAYTDGVTATVDYTKSQDVYRLTATANSGYVFSHWSVDTESAGGIYDEDGTFYAALLGCNYSYGETITMNPVEVQDGNGVDTTFTAHFVCETPTYTLERLYKASSIQESKTVTDNGTVVPDEGYEAIKEVIVNVPSNNFGETWVIDGYGGYLQSLSDMTVYFVSNGELFFGFRCTQDDGAPDGTYDCVNYVKPDGTLLYVGLNCVNSTYEKITLFEPASGDLLTVLQKCATKQA